MFCCSVAWAWSPSTVVFFSAFNDCFVRSCAGPLPPLVRAWLLPSLEPLDSALKRSDKLARGLHFSMNFPAPESGPDLDDFTHVAHKHQGIELEAI